MCEISRKTSQHSLRKSEAHSRLSETGQLYLSESSRLINDQRNRSLRLVACLLPSPLLLRVWSMRPKSPFCNYLHSVPLDALNHSHHLVKVGSSAMGRSLVVTFGFAHKTRPTHEAALFGEIHRPLPAMPFKDAATLLKFSTFILGNASVCSLNCAHSCCFFFLSISCTGSPTCHCFSHSGTFP